MRSETYYKYRLKPKTSAKTESEVEKLSKRFTTNKRGTSPAISSVIMVAAVITVGLAVVAWTTSTFSAQQQQTGEFFSSRIDIIRENFVIEDVWFYSSPTEGVNVTVRNIGAVDMTVEAINFNGTNHLAESQNIATGQAKTITVTWTPGWASGYYYIVVASARGQQIREFYSTSG